MTALRRVGVQFTEAQKKTIKTLVETGQTLEAQKIILGELQASSAARRRRPARRWPAS